MLILKLEDSHFVGITITLTIIGMVFAMDWMRFSNFIVDNIVYG